MHKRSHEQPDDKEKPNRKAHMGRHTNRHDNSSWIDFFISISNPIKKWKKQTWDRKNEIQNERIIRYYYCTCVHDIDTILLEFKGRATASYRSYVRTRIPKKIWIIQISRLRGYEKWSCNWNIESDKMNAFSDRPMGQFSTRISLIETLIAEVW